MSYLRKYIQFISRCNDFIGKAVSWLTLAIVILICFDVVRRYLFKVTTVAFLELEWYLFSMIFLLASGYSLRHEQHVRVDVFYHQFSEKTKAWVNFLGGVFFLLPFCVVIIYTSFRFAHYSYQLNENSPNPGGLPATYLIKGMICVGFVFLFFQATALILNSLLIILGQKGIQKND